MKIVYFLPISHRFLNQPKIIALLNEHRIELLLRNLNINLVREVDFEHKLQVVFHFVLVFLLGRFFYKGELRELGFYYLGFRG